jgi:catechol 2,3-dioxygenase-like lactoylglutathione lyase family enzyme
VKLNLLVIRCRDIHASKAFYETLGIDFIEEQHGNSPIHYAANVDGTIFELYPLKTSEAADNIRLGFISPCITETIIFTDPDGRKVEVTPKIERYIRPST